MATNPYIRDGAAETEATTVAVPHVIRGRTEIGTDCVHRSRDLGGSFTTAKLKLDDLVWNRGEPGPAFEVPVAEIIDFLVATGERLNLSSNPYLKEAAGIAALASPQGERVIRHAYEDLGMLFSRGVLEDEVDIIGSDLLDGWVEKTRGGTHRVRAYPTRVVHVPAGNAPIVAALTIVRAALTKGVHLIKIPSNDLFSLTAILRTMADLDPKHPVVQSFTAAYWRGGDKDIESYIYRPQYFDRVAAWGGEASMKHIQQYIGPGLELIPFDPKTSFSLIGREAFASEEALHEAARGAAEDVKLFNQEACACSRFQYVEGAVEQVDRFCELLLKNLGEDARYGDAISPILPDKETREEVEMLSMLEPEYRVFGSCDGKGIVVRSEEPVGFHPIGKLVNVVRVDDLREGVGYANVASQTVGVYPPSRKAEVRDALASAGVQRIVNVGSSIEDGILGKPHDAFYPLQRLVRWVADEGEDE